ncbi:MAG: hypothetical protein P1S60_12260 [Anaerolineae bacterium]|nr:hypothetical protein [Anaerolineae bacterium]
MQALPLDEMDWEIARFNATQRGRQWEDARPELDDVLPYAEVIANLSHFWKDKWRTIEAYTEMAYVAQALDPQQMARQTWQYPVAAGIVPVVCRSNLDVYSGGAGNYERFHGNLRVDGVEMVFKRAVDRGPVPNDELFLGLQTVPTVAELAESVGKAHGTRIYFSAVEMRQRWLDLAFVDYRRM